MYGVKWHTLKLEKKKVHTFVDIFVLLITNDKPHCGTKKPV